MLSRRLFLHAPQPPISSVCLVCACRDASLRPRDRGRLFTSTSVAWARRRKSKSKSEANGAVKRNGDDPPAATKAAAKKRAAARKTGAKKPLVRRVKSTAPPGEEAPKSLKEALLEGTQGVGEEKTTTPATTRKRRGKKPPAEKLDIEILSPNDLDFQPLDHKIPPVPMLSYGLDRVLFNPGVYRLQDPRSRVYNFDPYLEKIMSVKEFDFEALSEYKTSSKDEELLGIAKRESTRFTGSTSSMSGILQHFHFLLSAFRRLNHNMLSRAFPAPSPKLSKIALGPSAVFLRWKDGTYAIDADKSYDQPNIMSWLGHSLEKLLTTERDEFERYRRSSPDKATDDNSGRCYHYSKLGNFLMRSQLDAHDPRLPGTGVFDLKTRAVVSIRMDHKEYETGSGYQLKYDRGEWESFEREFYDMTRATMLKYSLQVRMGRMDGIFVAYHNIERIFGFQYLSLPDLDNVLHGQTDTCLGDQEFKLSIRLLDELLQRATQKFPETTLHLHFEAHNILPTPFMYIFAKPVTEEQADKIQDSKQADFKAFERDVVGVSRDDPEVQAEWHDIQDRVDEEVDEEVDEGRIGELAEGDEEAAKMESAEECTGDATEGSMKEGSKSAHEATDEPLMGWTLVVRNMVNGRYVDRPEQLEASDNWTIEYHIKEIAPETRGALLAKLKARRETLIGQDRETQSKQLDFYRAMIQRYSMRGRKWRQEQDEINEQMGQHVFRPLGPGSEAATHATAP